MAFTPQMRPEQAQIFQEAARLYQVFVLVRRTNAASLAHLGQRDCAPKRLDCKAKTADRDYVHPLHGPKTVAGLVVDPTVTGRAAFHPPQPGRPDKYETALREWEKFALRLHPAIRTLEGQRGVTYVPEGGQYFVDLDPASPRFGALKFSSSGMVTRSGTYIHGDFDLYGIVAAGERSRNVAVQERRLGEVHARSPHFFDVQHYVNRRLGVPMVLHGAQESYAEAHSDEGIDIFAPDGAVFGAENRVEIERLYATLFQGRRLFTRDGVREVVRGRYMMPG